MTQLRHVEILALSGALEAYARSLQSDVNAALLLVHGAVSRAFTEGGASLRPRDGLERSLRADIRSEYQASFAGA